VLTCIGNSFASRVAASLLNAVNLPELITTTQEQYESFAIELATKPEKLKKIKEKLIIFNQKIFFYKFNLLYEGMSWHGSRACRKKNFISPQWLRDTKHKKYPPWRLDIILSKTKYSSIHYVENGGWHFTNIKSPAEIEIKLSNFLHHQDFEDSGLTLDNIKEMVKNKKVLYDHSVDQKDYKWSGKTTLKKISLSEMPDYLSENNKKYANWLEI